MKENRPFTGADWQKTPAPVKKYIRGQERQIKELTVVVGQLLKRVENLEKRVNKNSQNSSKPPSSDLPYKKPKKDGKKSKLKRGPEKVIKGTAKPYLSLLKKHQCCRKSVHVVMLDLMTQP